MQKTGGSERIEGEEEERGRRRRGTENTMRIR